MGTKQLKELRNKAKILEPVLRIGKNGATDSLILEINKQLKKKKLIKIKILKSARENTDKNELINKILERTDSELVELVGYIFVLYKK